MVANAPIVTKGMDTKGKNTKEISTTGVSIGWASKETLRYASA